MLMGTLRDQNRDWVNVEWRHVTGMGSTSPRLQLGLTLKLVDPISKVSIQSLELSLWWRDELLGAGLLFGDLVSQNGTHPELQVATSPRNIQMVTDQLGNQERVDLQVKSRGVLVVSRTAQQTGEIVGNPSYSEPTAVQVTDMYPMNLQIPRGDWYAQVLARIGATDLIFLEILVPREDAGTPWRGVLVHLQNAERAYANGDDAAVFGHLHLAFESLPGAKKAIFDALPEPKRAHVNKLTTALSTYLHTGRHVADGSDQSDVFPVDHLDAGFALSLMKVLLSYTSKAVAAASSH
jgi:hypothetical protein